MKDVIRFLSKTKTEDKVPKTTSPMYRGAKLTKDNFTKFEEHESQKYRVFAIDGGSSVLINGGGWILAKVKVGSVGYRMKDRVFENVKEFYIAGILENGKIKPKLSPEVEKFEELKLKVNDVKEIPNVFRSLLEWQYASELVKQELETGDILLMDGSLLAQSEEHYNLMKKVARKAVKKGIVIVGITKESGIKTNTGRSALGYLNQKGEENFDNEKWFYHPIFKEEGSVEKDLGTNFVAKFHEDSDFCFKTQLEKMFWQDLDEERIKQIFGLIAYYSSDPELLGYPYPLLKVDKIARISNEERSSEVRKAKFMADRLDEDFIEYDEKSNIMHKFMDERAYKSEEE